MEQQGYQRYEISAYAKANQQAKHNINYWQFGDYLGLGAGAHSKITNLEKINRLIKHKHPKIYLDSAKNHRSFIQENKFILDEEKPLEFMMNALRLTQGVPLRLFQENTGLPIEVIQKKLIKAQSLNLISFDNTHPRSIIKPTGKGLLFLNNLVNLFSEST